MKKPLLKVDFHTHTTYSDGRLTPERLISRAKNLGVGTLAVTDHDTTAGLKEARIFAEQSGIHLVDGIEISCRQGDTSVHLLVYGSKVFNERLLQFVQNFREKKLGRVERILEKLHVLGFPISLEELDAVDYENLGRPHIGRAMVRKGYVQSLSEAFAKYLSPGRLAYVPREEADTQEAVRLLGEIGAVCAVAHPGQIRMEQGELFKNIKHWQSLGLCGIECYHPCHEDRLAEFYASYAKENNLLVLGGSDFHEIGASDSKHGELGDQSGRWKNLEEDVQQLLTRIG